MLLAKTEILPESECYWIAYSGGMDSHVLLHAFNVIRNELPADISAVHIDHGLSDNSGGWADHCRDICADLEIKLVLRKVEDVRPQGESIESWARNQRYTLIRQGMKKNDILFTAQHREDQAETLLLQLFRGAGPTGLAAMPELRKFGSGWHARPLLEFTREQLRDYAVHNRLSWIDDETNINQEFDRNFIRHKILPALKTRWPNISGVLSRVANHQWESAILLDEFAEADLNEHALSNPFTLSLREFQNLSLSRRKNLIRFWLKRLGMPLPDTRTLNQILSNVVSSRSDANPCVTWQGTEVRRYRNILYAGETPVRHEDYRMEKWDMRTTCTTALGELRAVKSRGRGIRAAAIPGSQLEVRYRRGGEIIQPAGKRHHQSLKKLLQENNVPPWFRDNIPLLYFNGDLVMVAGFWIDNGYHAAAEEESWEIIWEGAEKVVLKE